MITFISEKYSEILRANRLDAFETVWDYQLNWFEAPNERRNGWSGVGHVTLQQADGGITGAYLKKQDCHCRMSLFHPFRGVPTFQREFEMIQFLEKRNVRVPELLLFGRNPNGDLKTILMTRELEGFISFEVLTQRLFANQIRSNFIMKRLVIRALALFAKNFHATRLQHRSFYPKHLFINMKNPNAPEIAVIDLEKSRINLIPVLRSLIDLSTLNRHTTHWSKSRRMFFYLQYLGLSRMSPYAKWLCRLIVKRSNRRKYKGHF